MCCCCRRAAAAAAAAWPFGNFIDTDTTQSVGNCCIQRFVRSPTELKFEFASTRTRLSHFGSSHEARSFRSFVRSLGSYARLRFAHAACACVCVFVCVRLLVPVTECCSSSSSVVASVVVGVVQRHRHQFHNVISFWPLVLAACACACVFVTCNLQLASRTCVLVASLPIVPIAQWAFIYKQSVCEKLIRKSRRVQVTRHQSVFDSAR